MKNTLLTKKPSWLLFLGIAFLMMLPFNGLGQTLYEGFNYTSPLNIGGATNSTGGPVNNWFTHSNSQAGVIAVTSGSLSYTGLQASTGSKVRLPGSNSTVPRDVNRQVGFAASQNVTYMSFLLNVADNTQLSSSGFDYFAHFSTTNGTNAANFFARVGIKSVNTAANYRLGIANHGSTFTEVTTDLNFGTTYLVVVKYDAGASPAVATIWVNPSSLGGAEPTGGFSNSSQAGLIASYNSSNTAICLRNTSTTPKADIDEMRAGTTWASVTPASTSAPTVTNTAAANITSNSATLAGNVTATGGDAITATGSVYALTSADSTPTIGETNVTNLATALPGSGTGTFSNTTGTGLAVNAQYSYNAYATNGIGTSYGTAATFYTLAVTPNAPVVGSPTTSSLTVALDTNDDNPSGTEYAIQETGGLYVQANGSLGASPVWRNETAWGTVTVTGLTSVTTYTFQVKARNGANVETAFGATASATTNANSSPTVEADTLTAFGALCLNNSATNNFGLIGYNLTSANVTVGPLAGYTFSTSLNGTYTASLSFTPDVNGEVAETVYVKFTPTAVASYNGLIAITGGGLSSTVNVSVSGSGINTPVTAVTGAGTSVTATTAVLNGSFTAGCSAVTASGIEYSVNADFSASATVAFGGTASSLLPNTTYYFRTFATDATGTVTGTSATFTTLNLSAPIATAATAVGATSFTANWGAVTGATDYTLDVYTKTVLNLPSELFYNAGTSGSFNTGTTPAADGWIYTNTASASSYIKMVKTASAGEAPTIISPTVDATNYTTLRLNSKIGSFGSVGTGGANVITIYVSTNNGANWTQVATAGVVSGDINTSIPEVNLDAYVGYSQVKIKMSALSATTSLGGRLGQISLSGDGNGTTLNPVSGSPFTISAPTTSKVVNGLSSNTAYYYTVKAVNGAAVSPSSNEEAVTTEAILATFDAITQTGFECANASFALSGLTPGANTVYYTLNGTPSSTFLFADGTGNATLDLPVTDANNGQTLAVTAVELFNTPASNVTITPSANSAIAVSVTATITPTVSLSSSDADNTFAYGTGVTFTASASNLSGGTATYTFTVNGQTVQSGSSNTYTSSTLANANQVRASISISGGSCLTATTADSNVITNTVTGAVLTYITNFCGLTMPAIDSRIKCAVPSGVVGTLGYRFRVTNLTTNATATVDSSIANFNLTMTNIYAFGTSFSVQAAAVVNGVLQPYSAPCTITTPSLPTNQLVATSCGQTLESLNARIFASTVVGAQNYRWRVALSSAPTTYYELVTTSSSFRLTNVPNLPVSFGNTYLVAVQSDILVNGIATTTAYGNVCSVSTPSVNVISISANQCGQTLAGITDRIFINSVPNAVNYTYRVRKVGTTESYTFTTTATSFRLTSFTGLSLTFDSQYYVAVAASIVIDGTTFNAPFGPDCTISTPAYPTVGLQESQCSNGDPENPGAYQVTSSSELIYCEFVSGATYQFILQKLVNGTPQGSPVTLDRLGNFFSINMVHGLEAGTEYLVSVKLFYYGEGPQGKDCVIRTPEAVSSTRVAAKEFAATAYPNPFENNFLVDLTTSSQAPVSLKVYDMLGRLMTSYESKVNDLSTVAIGDQFPSGVYNVVVTQGDEVKTLRVVKR